MVGSLRQAKALILTLLLALLLGLLSPLIFSTKDTVRAGDSDYVHVYENPSAVGYKANFTAVTHDLSSRNPGVHFSWDHFPLQTRLPVDVVPGINIILDWIGLKQESAPYMEFRIDYVLQSELPADISKPGQKLINQSAINDKRWYNICRRNPNNAPGDTAAPWKELSPKFGLNGWQLNGKWGQNIEDARRKYEGKAFFRVVVHPGTKHTQAIACRTEGVDAMHDDPNGTTIDLKFKAVNGVNNTPLAATVSVANKPLKEYLSTNGLPAPKPDQNTTTTTGDPLQATFARNRTTLEIKFSVSGYQDGVISTDDKESYEIVAKLYTNKAGEVTKTSLNGVDLGSTGNAEPANNSKNACNQYLGFLPTQEFSISKYLVCQEMALINEVVDFMTGLFDNIPLNSWQFIQDRPNIQTVWKVVLAVIDFIVVGALVVAAFANIFRFKIDMYALKKILPGLIIGIVLMNLSYFIMRLFIESAAIATQLLAEIVGQYVQAPIEAKGASSYLANQAWRELASSLLLPPQNWPDLVLWPLQDTFKQAVQSGNDLKAGTVFALQSIQEIPQFFFLQLVLIVSLIAVVLFFVLVFLLLIRHIILIALYLMSPLAFFSLTFPPLRKFWDSWWAMTWKWTLMLPVSYAIVGAAIIFLHYANQGGINFYAWLTINGVGIFLLYQAVRFPFKWGQFFNTNAIDWWSKKGAAASKWTRDRAVNTGKRGWDLGATGMARLPGQGWGIRKDGKWWKRDSWKFDRPKPRRVTAATAGATSAGSDLYGVTREVGESPLNFARRVNERLAADRLKAVKDREGKYKSWNAFRAPEAIAAGWKKRQEQKKDAESGAIKGTEWYKRAAGKEVQEKEAADKRKDKFTAVDDFQELADPINKLNKHIVDEKLKKMPGYTPADESRVREEVAKMLRKKAQDPEKISAEEMEGFDLVKAKEALHASKRWISLANANDAVKTAAGGASSGAAAYEWELQNAGGAGGLHPRGFGTATATANGTGVGDVSEDALDAVQQAFEEVMKKAAVGAAKSSQEAISRQVRETFQRNPQSSLTIAKTLVRTQEEGLKQAIAQHTPDPVTAQKLFSGIARGVQKGQPLQAGQYGMSQQDLAQVVSAIRGPLDSYKAAIGTAREVMNTTPEGKLPVQQRADTAANIVLKQGPAANPVAIQKQAQTYMTALEGPMSQTEIKQVHQWIGQHDTEPVVQLEQDQLVSRIEKIASAAELLQHVDLHQVTQPEGTATSSYSLPPVNTPSHSSDSEGASQRVDAEPLVAEAATDQADAVINEVAAPAPENAATTDPVSTAETPHA